MNPYVTWAYLIELIIIILFEFSVEEILVHSI